MRSLLVVAKPVSWTLDLDRPRKTGSRYNDTLMLRKAKRVCDNVTKSNCLIPLLTSYLVILAKTALGGIFTPPPQLPGEGLIIFYKRCKADMGEWQCRAVWFGII